MVTVAQMKNVARFTFGTAEHVVQRYAARVEVVRGDIGDGHDIYRRHTHTLEGYLEGSSPGDLESQITDLVTELAATEVDFRVYRAGQLVVEILAANAHFGPVAAVDLNDGDFSGGLLQAFTATVTADVPITISSGLIDHQWVDTEETDDEGVSQNVRRGDVITVDGTSAKTWIESNLPMQPADTDRRITIDTNDSDTKATYTVTDSRTVYRNPVTNVVKDHQWVDTTVTLEGELILSTRRGSVTMIAPNDASDWINANAIPAPLVGFIRTITITEDDTTLSATYEVRDVDQGSVSWPPNVSDARRSVTTTYDEQSREIVVDEGRFVGSGAQSEVDAILAAMPGTIVNQSQTIETYEGAVSYRFTSIASDSTPSGLLAWSESVSSDAGDPVRIPILYPDRDPFIYNGPTAPVLITIRGQAEGLSAYVSPPGAPGSISSFLSGSPQIEFRRVDDERFVTTWVYQFVAPPATAVPKPRAPIVNFE